MKFDFNNLPDNYEGLHSRTEKYLREADIEYRYDKGQYFTPRSVQVKLLDKIPFEDIDVANPKILDPSCGTGEFLYTMNLITDDCELHGWDIDENLINIAEDVVPNADIKCVDSLRYETDNTFDLIIGNPPYFEFKPDDEIKSKYSEVMYGRTNIYALFIYKSINLLNDGGILAFVNPPSMNNGAYFKNLRSYIIETCEVLDIEIEENTNVFEDASQSIMYFVLKKGSSSDRYIFEKNGITIFSEGYKELQEAFEGKSTIGSLGYEVKTGSVIWNRNEESLSDDNSGVKLIYSKNITEDGLRVENHSKPQYMSVSDSNTGPAIVVNRVVGKPGSGEIRAALIGQGEDFLAENHVNVIKPKENPQLPIEHILEELNDETNVNIVQKITGNSQLSKNELENLFPIGTDNK